MLSWIHVFDFINAGFIFDYGQYHRQYYASVVADVILVLSSSSRKLKIKKRQAVGLAF